MGIQGAGVPIDIFAPSLAVGEIAEDWRILNAVHLIKKGSSNKPGNTLRHWVQ